MKTGRKTKYKKEYNKLVYKLCLLGLTDSELAKFFEIKEQTLNNWKKDYPEFFESTKRGKILADIPVVEKLYKRIKGYKYNEVHETKEQVYVDGKPVEGTERIITKTISKQVHPDVTAIRFWLINRQRKNWTNRSETTHSSDPEKPMIHKIVRVIIDPVKTK